ncbi:hypothetical protein Taro_038723, partial [Colocasia esculenta]|nr:hypothetical protein [Colocasia esculenta]
MVLEPFRGARRGTVVRPDYGSCGYFSSASHFDGSGRWSPVSGHGQHKNPTIVVDRRPWPTPKSDDCHWPVLDSPFRRQSPPTNLNAHKHPTIVVDRRPWLAQEFDDSRRSAAMDNTEIRRLSLAGAGFTVPATVAADDGFRTRALILLRGPTLDITEQHVRTPHVGHLLGRPSSTPAFVFPIFSSGGPFGSGPNRITPLHLAPSVGIDVAMARGRSSYQNVGSRATRSRQSRGDSRRRSPPVDVAIAPPGVNNDVPAPVAAAPATSLEVAELQGQMQQLTGVCLALQAQLAGPPATTVPLSRERQAESSHRRSRVLPAPQEQQADSLRRSHRAPSEERASERRGRSPRRSVASPRPPRSVVGGNSHASGRGGPANSEQKLARRLRRVVDLERRVDAMVQRAEGKAPAEDDLDFRSPFSREILEAQVPSKLPLPTIAPYDGTTDPADHIYGFESHMVFHGASDAAKCRAFPATLKETARAWFETLPAGSITSFRQLKKSFRDNFLGGRSQPRTATSLLAVRQKKGEALWDFVKRFRTEALRISRLDVPLATSALIQGTRDCFLQRTLGVQQPATLAELLSIAQRHAACEESLAASRAEQGEQSDKKQPSDNSSDRDRKKGRRNGDSPRRPRPFTNYTPLTVALEQILAEIRNEAFVRWPQRMRSDPRKRDQNKYCRFHRDHGHDTSECRQLKDEIEDLIKCGYLGRFVRRNEERPRRRERTPEQPINNEPNGQEINVIAGGFGAGEESTRRRRDYARRVHVVDRPSAPRPAPYPTSPARAHSEEAITFSDEDLVGVSTPHTDALVISATINHCNVRRILVDNGSAPDRESRRCYVLSLRDKQPLADPAPPTTDQPSTSRGTPAEDLIPVQ